MHGPKTELVLFLRHITYCIEYIYEIVHFVFNHLSEFEILERKAKAENIFHIIPTVIKIPCLRSTWNWRISQNQSVSTYTVEHTLQFMRNDIVCCLSTVEFRQIVIIHTFLKRVLRTS